MRKDTLWFLLILSALLVILGIISYFLTIIPVLTTIRPGSSLNAPQLLSEIPIAGLVITVLLLTAGGVIGLVGRIGTMIKQAKRQQWAWFICTLLFGWICQLVYLIVWPMPLHPLAAARRQTPQRRPVQPQQHHAEQPQRKKSVNKKRS